MAPNLREPSLTAPISPDECRTARAALGWSQKDLAERSGVGIASIKRFELGVQLHHLLSAELRRTLEGAGVAFLASGTTVGSVRVRLGVILVDG